jgi:hypothetical protein
MWVGVHEGFGLDWLRFLEVTGVLPHLGLKAWLEHHIIMQLHFYISVHFISLVLCFFRQGSCAFAQPQTKSWLFMPTCVSP